MKASFNLLLVLVTLFLVKSYLNTKVVKQTNYFIGEINGFCVNDLCLSKELNNYLVNGVPADDDLVLPYIEKLKSLQLRELVSQNKDKFADLGISDKDKVVLTVNGKGLQIGNFTTQYDGVYVKPANEDKVYRIEIVFDKSNLIQAKYWQKKLLINMPLLQITKVIINSADKQKEVVKDDGIFAIAAHLGVGNYLGTQNPGGTETKISVYTGKESQTYFVGKYWATSDHKFYFEINKNDFERLTSKAL